ncbi:uncharacterized protein LOC128883900 isoform X2 [Hylaeus volcanicus]|nr:uncharacterized protein LOC128883900 isoform X2 [Hylaeus volcanicus]
MFSSTECDRLMKITEDLGNMTDKYNAEYHALDQNGREFVNDQYNYFALTETYKVKENELWKMNSETQILTHVTELWNVEVSNAMTHITRLKEQLNVERMRQAELQKASKMYIQRTFQNVKRNRLSILEQDDFDPSTHQHREQFNSVVDKLGSLLDMISVNETSSNEKKTNKTWGLSRKTTNALKFL